jgi:hypothetical protein
MTGGALGSATARAGGLAERLAGPDGSRRGAHERWAARRLRASWAAGSWAAGASGGLLREAAAAG